MVLTRGREEARSGASRRGPSCPKFRRKGAVTLARLRWFLRLCSRTFASVAVLEYAKRRDKFRSSRFRCLGHDAAETSAAARCTGNACKMQEEAAFLEMATFWLLDEVPSAMLAGNLGGRRWLEIRFGLSIFRTSCQGLVQKCLFQLGPSELAPGKLLVGMSMSLCDTTLNR